MGSGRTELALALFGMTRFGQGELRLMANRSASARTGRNPGRYCLCFGRRLLLGLNLRQSIVDNAAITMLDRLANGIGLIPPRRRRGLAAEWITRLGIKASDIGAAVHTLSGGNQQRVVLAKWLATNPKILILDTPTAGVDIRNKQGIYDIIHKLCNEGVAVILISDEIPEVYYNADRILHMREGRLVGNTCPELQVRRYWRRQSLRRAFAAIFSRTEMSLVVVIVIVAVSSHFLRLTF
jgi:simple sugar transport system ATP-binding protein